MSYEILNPDTNQFSKLGLIYAGGTFGSHGKPLSPLDAKIFLPLLQEFIKKTNWSVDIIDNSIIKDSSTLTPDDFIVFYHTIKQAYQQGIRKIVLITGTDSLSFLAAFLAYAFEGFNQLCLVITGSMQPLLMSEQIPYCLNPASDAWENLTQSFKVSEHNFGVFVQFNHQTFLAKNTQKINSQDRNAFYGIPAKMNQTQIEQKNCQNFCNDLIKSSKQVDILAIYCLPNQPEYLAHQLCHLSKNTKAIILIGFGSGNIPSSPELIQVLKKCQQQKIAVVCTTMCAFGGTNNDYAAGAWQYQYGVWFAGQLSVSAIYGQLLWLILTNRLDLKYWKIS